MLLLFIDVSVDGAEVEPDGIEPVVVDGLVVLVDGLFMVDGLVVVDGAALGVGPDWVEGDWTPGPGFPVVPVPPVCAVAKPTMPTMAAAATAELKVLETFTGGLLRSDKGHSGPES